MNLDKKQMHRFRSGDIDIAYLDEGPSDGTPILLIHGFASTAHVNWVYPGWVKTLTQAGYRTIALDNRGHGESDKPHDPDAYTASLMAGDGLALLDHLGIEQAHVFGYSMGARNSAFLAHHAPERVNRLVLGGLAAGLVKGVGDWTPIAEALLADSIDDVTHARGRMFRAFAEQTKSDRKALAACITSREELKPKQLSRLTMPVLVGVGTKDDIAGSPEELVAMLPNARGVDIPNRDHMLAVGDKVFKAAVLKFLAEEGSV
ncbi:alpha/beta fold hydrolase [Georhizobium sp. MAB10]|uniref:alpha/beta fold hydrolase n=1 Tax=Georhizobium sp. MAB10 TaxID=3028319 RepID=UPI003855ECAB